ncbi:MAG: hypothetical protein WBQ78_11970 [Gammaproteobacteria bacterium]
MVTLRSVTVCAVGIKLDLHSRRIEVIQIVLHFKDMLLAISFLFQFTEV